MPCPRPNFRHRRAAGVARRHPRLPHRVRVGLAGYFGWLHLPEALQARPVAVGAGRVRRWRWRSSSPTRSRAWIRRGTCCTLLRIPAGAFLAAAAFSPTASSAPACSPPGAGAALASHALKTGTRAEHLARTGQQLDRLGHRGRHHPRRAGAGVRPPLARPDPGGDAERRIRAVRLVAVARAVPAQATATGRE